MLFSTLIPNRWRRGGNAGEAKKAGFYNRLVTPYLQTISNSACTHPVYTIACVVVAGSALYVNLLDSGFFQPSAASTSNRLDFDALTAGSRRLHLGAETSWSWQVEENGSSGTGSLEDVAELALIALEFPTSDAATVQVPATADGVATQLPAPANSFAPLSSGTNLAFSMLYKDTRRFLEAVKEFPAPASQAIPADDEQGPLVGDECGQRRKECRID